MGKPLRAKKRTNKLNPHMTPSLGLQPCHIGVRRVLSPLRHHYEKTCDDICWNQHMKKPVKNHLKTYSKFDSTCWMLIWSYSITTYCTSEMKSFHLIVALSHGKMAGYESAKKISACLFLESLVVGFLPSLVCNITYSTKQSRVETNVTRFSQSFSWCISCLVFKEIFSNFFKLPLRKSIPQMYFSEVLFSAREHDLKQKATSVKLCAVEMCSRRAMQHWGMTLVKWSLNQIFS